VLLNLWATWCGLCVKEMPYLEELSARRAIEVLGVNMNEPRARVAEFVAAYGITFPILLEPDEVVKIMYSTRALPRTVLVAPDGTVAGLVMGAVSPQSLDSWLEAHAVARVSHEPVGAR
jgi:thiol-disulfide isomerase/thioredoxin